MIMGDYEYIMPVPYRKKFGINYVYRPNFCQQLGVFSPEKIIRTSILNNFINELCSKYKHIHYPLNHFNTNFLKNNVLIKKRTNLVLNLNKDFDSIYSQYSPNLKRDIKKAENQNLIIKENEESDHIIKLYKEAWQTRHNISDQDYANFKKVVEFAKRKNICFTYGVYHNELISGGCIIFKYHNRLYYPFSGITLQGKKINSIAFLINRLIQLNANTNSIFDFEGSDIESVKHFYKKFNPINEPYFLITKSVYIIESFIFFRYFFKNVLFFKNKSLIL